MLAACGGEGEGGAGDTPDPGRRTASPCTPCSRVTAFLEYEKVDQKDLSSGIQSQVLMLMVVSWALSCDMMMEQIITIGK